MSGKAVLVVSGNLSADPEMKFMPDGRAVTTFAIVCGRKYTKNDGTEVEEKTWYNLAAFGKKAELINEYCVKGDSVMIEGHLRSDPKTGGPIVFTRQDGTAGARFEVIADEITFLNLARWAK